MTSYSQMYKKGPRRDDNDVLKTQESFMDMYLQDAGETVEKPMSVQETVEAAREVRQDVAGEENRETPEQCPEHLKIDTNIFKREPVSGVRLAPALERRLKKNISELSIIEGNILSRERRISSLYVTSCFNGEGKTVTALSMAYSLSVLSGKRVLFMDGSNSFPKLHSLFGIRQAPGLTDVLKEQTPFSTVCVPTAYQGLFVVPLGTSLSHGMAFFVDHVRWILKEAATNFDYLVWDGTSVLQASQASALAELFDGICLVVECERTKWEVVQMAKDKIEKSGGNIVGVVMNKRRFYIPRWIYKLLSNR